ncbi:Galactose oxidase/kelch repeat superfamily protein [Rhynchospora pubera]|uniref:Galactose oxidase/kelch repeat superfamily protein n=1 Tax=Rhynchospora pubera TaxID=906938 RepID=A0AAV8F7A4_9POAL|nr:Galactose oxidase/kelch repeat superfamily protein [Rhynchospora pubera]
MQRRKHAPLVDASACLCRADIGPKTISDTKKYVPKTKLCIQPNLRASIHPSKPKRVELAERSRCQSPLIPGLPDDLAIACLIRVPRSSQPKLRLVCKRWQRLLAGNYFYTLRRNYGLAEEWIYVIKRNRDGRISWDAFDPVSQLWHPLPPVPAEYSEAVGFGCAVLSGCLLYMFGGRDPRKGCMRRVIFYSARTNRWHRAPDMLRRRNFMGSCVLNNCLYVAGGETESGSRTLRSAEMFDPVQNRWSFISEMCTPMVPFIGMVYEGKWYLKGLGSQRQVLSEVYYPETDTWSPVLDNMVSGWRNPSLCLNDRLFVVDCKDGCKLRVYDKTTHSWCKFGDSKQHSGISRSSEAAALVVLNGKLCVVRNNMCISLIDVSGDAQWEMISSKGQIKTFVTNLWSSVVGRGRSKSHIVHCKVLQA